MGGIVSKPTSSTRESEGRERLVTNQEEGGELVAAPKEREGEDFNMRRYLSTQTDPESMIFVAVSRNNQRSVQLLELIEDKSVNVKNDEGRTPIFYAAYFQNQKACDILLANGADLSIKDNDGNSILEIVNRDPKLSARDRKITSQYLRDQILVQSRHNIFLEEFPESSSPKDSPSSSFRSNSDASFCLDDRFSDRSK